MKERIHISGNGEYRWRSDDILDIQNEIIEALYPMLQEISNPDCDDGNIIIQGCHVISVGSSLYDVSPGLVALWDSNSHNYHKICRFDGITGVGMDGYLVMAPEATEDGYYPDIGDDTAAYTYKAVFTSAPGSSQNQNYVRLVPDNQQLRKYYNRAPFDEDAVAHQRFELEIVTDSGGNVAGIYYTLEPLMNRYKVTVYAKMDVGFDGISSLDLSPYSPSVKVSNKDSFDGYIVVNPDGTVKCHNVATEEVIISVTYITNL